MEARRQLKLEKDILFALKDQCVFKNLFSIVWRVSEGRVWNKRNLVGKLGGNIWDKFGVCFEYSQDTLSLKKKKDCEIFFLSTTKDAVFRHEQKEKKNELHPPQPYNMLFWVLLSCLLNT